MQDQIIDIILVVAVVAIATLALILFAEWIMTAIGNKGNKKTKKSKNDSKNQGKVQEDYFYNENANLEDDEKFLLNLDDDESNVNGEKSTHYDEAQAEKEKALALKDKGNDIDHFSEPAGFGTDDEDDNTNNNDDESENDSNSDNIEEENENNDDSNEELSSNKTKEKGSANPFLFDDSDDDDEVKLNKGDDSNKSIEQTFNITDDDNEESSQNENYLENNQDYSTNESNDSNITNGFIQDTLPDYNMNGEQQFRFEDENDTISPTPKSADKNFETPSDEELIDFINQKALEDYEMSTNSLNPFNLNNNSPIDYNDILNDDSDNEVNEQIMQKDAMILRLQEELDKTKEDKNQDDVVKITPVNESVQENTVEDNTETKSQDELNRDRIRAEVNKQMQINKLAEKEEYYREQIKKLQEQHAEELRKVQEQNSQELKKVQEQNTEELKKVQEQSNEEIKKIYDQNKLLNEQIESSRQEMENKLKNQIDLLTTSKNQMANEFKDQLEKINSNNEEQQNMFINEINKLKEELQNASTPIIQEVPVVQPTPIIEEVKEEVVEEEPEIDLPKKTDPKYEELIIKIQNLETRLRAVNKSLRNNKKEYVPLIKAQKYINDNNDRFNRKSNNVAKLKAQLSKPKYADDKEKLAKYDSEMEIYEQLRIDMTRNKEYLDLNAGKIPILEKENATLTKQQTELENQLNILKTELKRYE